MAQQAVTIARYPVDSPAVKLAKLHITAPGAHIGGSYETLLMSLNGWDITIRPELGGVIAQRNGGEKFWIPFAAIRNGTLADAPT
jgi:hypothetical protein